jgi:magnesium-transporting ATPase (P-type)
MAFKEGMRKKTSQLEKTLNRLMIFALLVVLALVCISLALTAGLQSKAYSENYVEKFLIYLILYSNLAPIAIFAAMDVIRAS